MATWALIANRVSGSLISADQIELTNHHQRHVFPVSALAGYRVQTWSDGAPDIYLRQMNGEEFRVPGQCIGKPEAFLKALDQLGLPREK